VARRKLSSGKATWPGRKQVWRRYAPDGTMVGDILSTENDSQPGEPQIKLVMQNGRRVAPSPSLAEIRARATRDLARLPDALRRLEPGATYEVKVADALKKLATEVDRRLTQKVKVRS